METRPRLFHHIEDASWRRRCTGSTTCRWSTPRVPECLAFYAAIGFRLSEYVVGDDGETPVMVFLQRKGNPHDMVFSQGPGPRLHHVAYTVPETRSLMDAADIFVRAGMPGRWNSAPHVISVRAWPASSTSGTPTDTGSSCSRATTRPSTSRMSRSDGRAPDFRIGGWQTPPDRWFNEATAFAKTPEVHS